MSLSPQARAKIAACAKARWAKCKAKAAINLPAVPTAPKSPAIQSGDPEEVAARFKDLFAQAEDAKFRVAAFGIYAQHIKLNLLKHGQFYDWVSATIGGEHLRTVQDHMLFAKSTLERIGFRTLKAFFSNPQTLRICHSGEFLLLPDAEVPAEAKPIRDKVFSLFAGKSKYQLCSEWKQVVEDETGHRKVQVGRLPGQGGASKLQRDQHNQKTEAHRLEAIDLHAVETSEWLLEVSDDKHLGLISELTQAQLLNALDTAAGYLRRRASL